MRWIGVAWGLVVVAGACEGPPSRVPLTDEVLWTSERVAECFNMEVMLGDIDGDGITDYVVYDPNCSTWGGAPDPTALSVYRGNAGGRAPELAVTILLNDEDVGPFGLETAVGDVDGDGDDDIYIDGWRGSDATLYLSSGDAGAAFDNPRSAPDGGAAFVDLDGDGRDELIGRDFPNIMAWSLNQFDAFQPVLLGPGLDVYAIDDLDGNGIPEVIVRESDGFTVLRDCRLTAGCVGTEPFALDGAPAAAGDVDGDGRGDLMVRRASGALALYTASDGGTFTQPPIWSIVPDPLDFALGWPHRLGDIDGDRTADLGVPSGNRLLLFRGTGDGPEPAPSWEWTPERLGFESGGITFVGARDLNRDRHADLVFRVFDESGFYLVAAAGGSVPAGVEPPFFPDRFACDMHEGDRPDFGVDASMLERSVRVVYRDFATDACELTEACVAAPGRRKLLDFSVAVQNFGGVAAKLPGPNLMPDLYSYDECHGHHHLVDFADYELLDEDGEVVVSGHKQGYFLADIVAYCDVPPAAEPNNDYLFISPGWADIYPAGLACQWIDITGVPDGDYQLRVRVNANGVFDEDDRIASEATVSVRLAGDTVTALPGG